METAYIQVYDGVDVIRCLFAVLLKYIPIIFINTQKSVNIIQDWGICYKYFINLLMLGVKSRTGGLG